MKKIISEIEEKNEFSMIKKFLAEGDKARIASLLKTNNGRKRFIQKLAHSYVFDKKFLHKIDSKDQTVEEILSLILKRNSPQTCYVISENSNLDGSLQNIRDALDKTVACGMGTILCCIPGVLLYVEMEDPGERYLVY